MKAAKIVGILVIVYILIVVVFESLLGYFQPTNEGTMVITTTNAEGEQNPRVLSKLESNGQLYAAANHWPRAWYSQALENPNVQVTIDGEAGDYVAVPVEGDEHLRVDAEHSLGPVFKVLTGFPPRYFLRLEPR